MKFLLNALFLIVMQPQACNSPNAKTVEVISLPKCIEDKIIALKAAPKTNPPAEVLQYIYKGQTVYLFSSPCCDQYNMLYDEQCNVICAPSGGLTGKGDRKCTDFNDSATLVKTVFKDNR